MSRLWQTINPVFLSHQLNYIKNHLGYDMIFWDGHAQYVQLFDTKKFRHILRNFTNFAQANIKKDIFSCAVALGEIMGTAPRAMTCPGLYSAWGSVAPPGEELWKNMSVLYNKAITISSNQLQTAQWQLLLTLEGLMPWEQFNGFLTKLLWNVFRCYLGLPLAMLPIKNKDLYYRELIIFLDKLITNNPLLPNKILY